MLGIGSALAGAGLIAVAVARGGEPAARETEPAARVVVEMRGFGFQPARVSAAIGDTVVWVNRDALPHTATAADGAWDSGELAGGQSWSRVVTEAGAVDYVCAYHPTMRGRIDVAD
jgi:plastocyanin